MGDINVTLETFEKARQGDRRAFDALALAYQGRIALWARRNGLRRNQSGHAVDDVTQNVLLALWQSLPNFKGTLEEFEPWLSRITRNVTATAQRANARDTALLVYEHELERGQSEDDSDDVAVTELEELCPADNHTPEASLLLDEVGEEIYAAIDRLPAEFREAVVLRELEGLTLEEIANEMGCSVGTVKSRLSRARALLSKNTRLRQLTNREESDRGETPALKKAA